MACSTAFRRGQARPMSGWAGRKAATGHEGRAGREVQVMLMLNGVGESADCGAVARIETAAGGLRGAADGWTVASVRVMRKRFTFARDGGWRRETIVRCRCLAG